MRKLLLMLAILTFSLAGISQTNSGTISGTVIDGNAKTLASATITLLNAADSTVAKMSVADKTGKYQFETVPFGRYMVSVSVIGHNTGYSEVIDLNAGNAAISVKLIELVPQAKAIGGVTVTARKPLIEQKLDRMIVNVEASITNVGASALEVLEKSPGVTVDKDGNISLKGKQGVVILVDGRPSYLGGADLANLLRSMSASQLEQIEIMTNPPAKFDASGNSGVINIKTKKNKQFGYNGSFTTGVTQGRYTRFNDAFNFNYRNGKVNLFTNLNYSRNNRGEDLYILRNFRESDTKNIISVFDQHSSMRNKNHFVSAKAGIDYSASKRTTLGAVISGYYNPSTWQSNTATYIFEPDMQLRSQTNSYTRNEEKWKNFSTNFNVRHVFDSAGQEITSDLDYVQYRSTSNQPLYSADFDKFGNPSGTPDTLLGTLPQDITIYSGKVDYSKPLKNGAKFEAGLKFSNVETDNNAVYENLFSGSRVLDSGRSNHFIYKENINAGYINYSRPLGKKWSGQFGLRVENTNASGDSKGYVYSSAEGKFVPFAEQFKRNYTQLFPTAYIQYKASENNSFVLNYGRRINRPDYGDLNPFIHFLDIYTFEQGNPNLKPQFSHNIELSHTHKGFLTSTLNYSNTTDIIQQVLEQNTAQNETFIKKANIASRKQVGLTISANKQIRKWWSGNVYANVAHNQFNGVVDEEPISAGIVVFMMQAQQQFKWGKGWAAEVSGVYRSKGLEGVIYIQPIVQFSAGFSKQVLKEKGSVRLNVRDIFAGGVFKGHSKYGTVDAQFRDVNDSRAVSLSFSWRFNKGKLKANGSRNAGGATDEQQRVGGGN